MLFVLFLLVLILLLFLLLEFVFLFIFEFVEFNNELLLLLILEFVEEENVFDFKLFIDILLFVFDDEFDELKPKLFICCKFNFFGIKILLFILFEDELL